MGIYLALASTDRCPVLEDIGLFHALPFIRHLVQESRSRKDTVRTARSPVASEAEEFQ